MSGGGFIRTIMDDDLLCLVLGMLDPAADSLDGLSRNGRLLLALPRNRGAFSKAIRLYQPQRPAAKLMISALHLLSVAGLQGCVLRPVKPRPFQMEPDLRLDGVDAGSCGVLLGSPEHRNRRAIASFRRNGSWEVAKIAPSAAGADALEHEAGVLERLGALTPGVPQLLGFHRSGEAALMRMPYLTGTAISPGNTTLALDLLSSWIASSPPLPAEVFPEWPAIESALIHRQRGPELLSHLAKENLHPTIRHGDFARWNLLAQPDGGLMVLDWEWGHPQGMPGLDLVHFFLQDSRLVHRHPPREAIRQTLQQLLQPDSAQILARSGWSGQSLLPVIASLAFKQGAAHQENGEMLDAAFAQLP